jgi:hypothetical protein
MGLAKIESVNGYIVFDAFLRWGNRPPKMKSKRLRYSL